MLPLTDVQIEAVMLAHGYTKKAQPDGSLALNPYVFAAARALLALAQDPVISQVPWGYLAATPGEIWAQIDRPDDAVRLSALYPILLPEVQGEPVAFYLSRADEAEIRMDHDLDADARARQAAEGWTLTPLTGWHVAGPLSPRVATALRQAGFSDEDAQRLGEQAAQMDEGEIVWQVRPHGSTDAWVEVPLQEARLSQGMDVRRLIVKGDEA